MNEDHPPISLDNSELEEYTHTRHTIKNPNFFLIDKISNEYITDHNEK